MKKQLRLALSAGVTFGIVTIFLFLIGFTGTSGDLLADLFGNKNAAPFIGLTPQMLNMLIFLALLGLWAGANGSVGRVSEVGRSVSRQRSASRLQ